jgi:hypothetical protein
MEDRLKDAQKIVKSMDEDINLKRVEEFIKDNKITFDYEGKQYRVKMLNLKEKEELDMLRRKKFSQLVQEKDDKGNYVYLLEQDLIKILKERGLDIEEINDEIKKLDSRLIKIQLDLGESLSKNEGEVILKTYEEDIKEVILQKQVLFTQKNLLLTYSLENCLENYVYQVITFLSFEKLEEEIWIKAFDNLEDFQNCKDENLIIKAGQFSLLLQPN